VVHPGRRRAVSAVQEARLFRCAPPGPLNRLALMATWMASRFGSSAQETAVMRPEPMSSPYHTSKSPPITMTDLATSSAQKCSWTPVCSVPAAKGTPAGSTARAPKVTPGSPPNRKSIDGVPSAGRTNVLSDAQRVRFATASTPQSSPTNKWRVCGRARERQRRRTWCLGRPRREAGGYAATLMTGV